VLECPWVITAFNGLEAGRVCSLRVIMQGVITPLRLLLYAVAGSSTARKMYAGVQLGSVPFQMI
jgi:hypothetical protein